MLGIPFVSHLPGFSVLIACVLSALGTDFDALNLYVRLFGAAGAVLLAMVVVS